MTIKTTLGNGLVAIGGYAGTKTIGLVLAATDYTSQLSTPYSLAGFIVPQWFGIAFYIAFLVFGTAVGVNQPTPFDEKMKYAILRPFYSLAFGVLGSVFIMPLFYPDITIWGMIIPAAFFAAIGVAVIYSVVAFFTSSRLWLIISEWGYKSVGEYLKGLPERISAAASAAAKAFFGGDK